MIKSRMTAPDRRVDDRSDYSATDHDAQSPEHPSADERAHDADNDVADSRQQATASRTAR
jgi:hypothetical protein